jgi:hypothetical protein
MTSKKNVEIANVIVTKLAKNKQFVNSYMDAVVTKPILYQIKNDVYKHLMNYNNSGSFCMDGLYVNVETDGSGTLCIWVDEENYHEENSGERYYVN